MSCDICGKDVCCPTFHSPEEQEKYAEVIEAFKGARELRVRLKEEEVEES